MEKSRENSGKSENYTSWKSYIQIKSLNNYDRSIMRLTIIKNKIQVSNPQKDSVAIEWQFVSIRKSNRIYLKIVK